MVFVGSNFGYNNCDHFMKLGIVIPYVEEHVTLVNKAYRSIIEAKKLYNDVNVYVYADTFRVGVPKILNEVLESFEDEYFCFFSADDLMMVNALERLKDFNGDWCYGDYIGSDGKYYYSGHFDKERLKRENYIPCGSVFVRTEIIKKIKWNEELTYCEDWEMWLHLSEMNLDVTYINQPQYYYNLNTSVFNKGARERKRNVKKFRSITAV